MSLEPNDAAAVAVIMAAIDGVVAVYRFGSTVSGAVGPESDVDVAVLATARIDPLARFDLQEHLARALHSDVDLVDLRAASPVLAMQVIAHGRLLLDGDAAARGQFEDFTYGAYARLNDERREILARVTAEGTVYGR